MPSLLTSLHRGSGNHRDIPLSHSSPTPSAPQRLALHPGRTSVVRFHGLRTTLVIRPVQPPDVVVAVPCPTHHLPRDWPWRNGLHEPSHRALHDLSTGSPRRTPGCEDSSQLVAELPRHTSRGQAYGAVGLSSVRFRPGSIPQVPSATCAYYATTEGINESAAAPPAPRGRTALFRCWCGTHRQPPRGADGRE